MLFMDKALSRRLERAEGVVNATFIDTRAATAVDENLTWCVIAGTYAMFDGPSSPMTQSFGLGLFDSVSPGDLAGLERFFHSRGADVSHEVSPLAGVELQQLLAERGYHPAELTTVLVRGLEGANQPVAPPAGLTVRVAEPHESEAWVETSVLGWAESPDLAEVPRRIASVGFANPAITSYFAFRDGKPIATGAIAVHDGVAMLAGASTIPGERGKGAQQALLAARLAAAASRGCDVAVMGAEPGGTSQRNAERNGFRVAYTRSKWRLPVGEGME